MKILYKEIKDKQYKDYDPEIIAWQREQKEDLNTALMYSFPQPGDNIKNKRYFAVKDYERVLFYNKGELVGDLGGGIYEIDKKARVKGTEIVWIDISLLSIPWGIPIKNGIPSRTILLFLFSSTMISPRTVLESYAITPSLTAIVVI